MENKKNENFINWKGFTLIELLIVIGIITILASAVIIAINPGEHFKRAREATRMSHANSIVNAVYSYAVDNDGDLPSCTTTPDGTDWDDLFPGTWGDYSGVGTLSSGAASDDWDNVRPVAGCYPDLAGGDNIYLPDLPQDPQPSEYYTISSNEDGTRIQISTSAHEDEDGESGVKVTQ